MASRPDWRAESGFVITVFVFTHAVLIHLSRRLLLHCLRLRFVFASVWTVVMDFASEVVPVVALGLGLLFWIRVLKALT